MVGCEDDPERQDQEDERRDDDPDDRGKRQAEDAPANDPIPERLGMDDPLTERVRAVRHACSMIRPEAPIPADPGPALVISGGREIARALYVRR